MRGPDIPHDISLLFCAATESSASTASANQNGGTAASQVATGLLVAHRA
jgi:hypothetical protein